jgi:iron complex outermembrane receptor protein
MLKRWAIVFPLLTISLCVVPISFVRASGEPNVGKETERAARIAELQREKTAVEQELRQLQARPEGTALSTVPRSEMENQPTRSQKEPLESVPGVAVRPGGNGRMQEFTIRGVAP